MGAHSAEIPYFRGLPFINLVNKFKPYGIPTSHFQRAVDRLEQKQYFPDLQFQN